MTALTQADSLSQIQTGLQAFEERKNKVSELAQSSSEVTLADWKDKNALKEVAAKRKEVKAERVAIQKEGKSMRDLITPVTKLIKSKEDELVAILEPEEERLQKLEDWADQEAENERQAAIAAENARIQKRIDALAEFGYQIDYSDIKAMTDDTFDKYLEAAKVQFQKEQAEKAEQERLRLEQEEQERAAKEEEQRRIAAEKAELEKLRKEQAEREAELRKQQEEVEAEKRKLEEERRQAELAKQQEEERLRREQKLKAAEEKAAEAAKLKAIEDAKEAERIKKEAEDKARIAAERKAARQPDKVKIQAYINNLRSVVVPEMKTQDGKDTMKQIQDLMQRFDKFATEKADEL